jgi:cytochrome c554/c'-like protein
MIPMPVLTTAWSGRALLALALLALTGVALGDTRSGLSPAEREFLEQHWKRPIPLQGPAPARFSPIEKSLAPASCGTCHVAQFADWKATRHARALGPGVAAQLIDLARTTPKVVPQCLACHAPLAEQQPVVITAQGAAKNGAFDSSLEEQGLVCAACHTRHHERFGPPRRDGQLESTVPRGSLPHNGVTRTGAFLRSEFCASCHQFGPGGPSLNGKPLENTYAEWRASHAGRAGRQCQDCHMPDRRHLWRGIHDPAMVRSGVRINVTTERGRYRPGDELRATLSIESTNVGHFFPTYVTPKIVVRAVLMDTTGRPVAGSEEEASIGRDVPVGLSRERADTRIAPGGRFTLAYRRRLDRSGLRLAVTVTVFPDHFYTEFFESILARGAGAETGQIQEALAETRRSSFVIFSREVPLT